MTGPPRYPESDHDTSVRQGPKSPTSPFRWVYVFWTIGITLILLMVILHLTGAMSHGLHGIH